MASKSPSILSLSTSEEDIELIDIEDSSLHNDGKYIPRPYDPHMDMDDESEGDEGETALLGSLGSSHRPRGPERIAEHSSSSWFQVKGIVIESAPTLLLTTVGLLFTGELLDHVSHWRAMRTTDELIMIIPVILNLKGNLEMNLSARLGTAANVGELDDPQRRNRMILGNLALLQVQATVVSFVAACVSIFLGLFVPQIPSVPESSPSLNTTSIPTTITPLLHHFVLDRRRPRPPLPINEGRPKSGFVEFVMVASSAMSAACFSSIILGSFMCGLIVLCRRFGRDPDNIAPPIASCLGDLVTLCLLGAVSAALINFVNTPIPLIVAFLVVLSSIVCVVCTRRNPFVRDLIGQGWSPLFGAMVISSATGIVLDLFASRYEGFPLLAIVISGLPGSVGSIFVSRLSTALHAAKLLPSSHTSAGPHQWKQPSHYLVMITLLLITLPVEVIFLSVLHGLGWLRLPFVFAIFSIIFFCCAVIISLFVARFLVNFLWSKNLDPDMYALPIHSALMDLVGQLLLVLCFEIVSGLGAHLRTKTTT